MVNLGAFAAPTVKTCRERAASQSRGLAQEDGTRLFPGSVTGKTQCRGLGPLSTCLCCV